MSKVSKQNSQKKGVYIVKKINWTKFITVVVASIGAFVGLQQTIPELQNPIANIIMAGILAAVNAFINTKKEPKNPIQL
jgi:hypothetical protein